MNKENKFLWPSQTRFNDCRTKEIRDKLDSISDKKNEQEKFLKEETLKGNIIGRIANPNN